MSGVVPKWLKGAVCKTVIRRFESGRRLYGCARVVELVDTMDLKSIVRKDVPVRVRPRVLIEGPVFSGALNLNNCIYGSLSKIREASLFRIYEYKNIRVFNHFASYLNYLHYDV